jgi:predicted dehydrogenase
MLRTAIVGCGKIADSHASQIKRIKGCEIVGVCDREPLMARQLYDRFPVKKHFSNLAELLTEAKPDVVHITTPPEGHFDIARQCLEAGCHVYVEKPFSIDVQEAIALVALAKEKKLKITAGHDDQFRHAARRMRSLVQEGYLGGAPVHMESHYCYQLGGAAYAEALLADKQHWVRKLPGKLLHNVISHGIARIAEYLTTDSPLVIAHGFSSPFLRSKEEEEIIDELRVIVSEEDELTGYFTFSSQMRPSLHQFVIYGPKNGLMLDQDQEILIKLSGTRRKSYAEHFVSPAVMAKQYAGNVLTNVRSFLARDFHMKSGMKYLIEAFYKSITEGTRDPIAPREIILTAKIMDEIFSQLGSPPRQKPNKENACHSTAAKSVSQKRREQFMYED